VKLGWIFDHDDLQANADLRRGETNADIRQSREHQIDQALHLGRSKLRGSDRARRLV
jgi:hypothetical protein